MYVLTSSYESTSWIKMLIIQSRIFHLPIYIFIFVPKPSESHQTKLGLYKLYQICRIPPPLKKGEMRNKFVHRWIQKGWLHQRESWLHYRKKLGNKVVDIWGHHPFSLLWGLYPVRTCLDWAWLHKVVTQIFQAFLWSNVFPRKGNFLFVWDKYL